MLGAPRHLVCVIALACALIAAPAARADHGEPYTNRTLATYLEIAEAHWGVPAPTCLGEGGQTIPVHVVLFDNPDPMVTATAEQPGCRIWLDRDWWPARPNRIDCTVVAHEWGHLLGYGHSPERRELMYEQPLTGAPGCSLFEAQVAVGTAVAHSSSPRPRKARRTRRARAVRPRVRRSQLEHRVVRR